MPQQRKGLRQADRRPLVEQEAQPQAEANPSAYKYIRKGYSPQASGSYSALMAAAALQRAAAAHVAEALACHMAMAEASGSSGATRDLTQLLVDARALVDALAALAAQEGGAAW